MNVIYTIGYGGREIKEFIELLQKYKIDRLVDVRTSLYTSAYHRDFHKKVLPGKLKKEHIKYTCMCKNLGGRPGATGKDYFKDGKLNAERCEGERGGYMDDIETLKSWAQRGKRLAIMCSEKDPARCHRSYVVGRTLAKYKEFEVLHIDKAGECKTQSEVEAEVKAKIKPKPKVKPKQAPLF